MAVQDCVPVPMVEIDAGLTQAPNSAQLYLARGILYSQLAEYGNAMADFERANRIDPNLASTAEGLLQSQQHHLNAAIRKFRIAAKQSSRDAYAQYLLDRVVRIETGLSSVCDLLYRPANQKIFQRAKRWLAGNLASCI